MIILRNPGVIDIDFIKLMGVNVKEAPNSIGFFGTGLKYAIAVFLREGLEVKLYAGEVEYTFMTQTKNLRGQEFKVCIMRSPLDYVELPFTTDLGKNWQLWQAYRELESNCRDEGGEVYNAYDSEVSSKFYKEGYTTFVIPDIDTDGIFLKPETRKLVLSTDQVDIYDKPSVYMYYRGIRAKDLQTPSRYTYDIKRRCTLTEDRLLCYDYEVLSILANTVARTGDKELIKNIITTQGGYEQYLHMAHYASEPPSEAFLEVHNEEYALVADSVKRYVTQHTPLAALSVEQVRERVLREFENLAETHGLEYKYENKKITMTGGILDE